MEGRFLPGTVLVRRLTAQGRAVPVQLHLAPRFGYTRKRADRTGQRAGALMIESDDLALAVTSDGPVIEADRTVDFLVDPRAPVDDRSHRHPPRRGDHRAACVAAAEAARDEERWRSWAEGILAVTHRAAVVRSLITLKLLTYSPSGAPVAAPTTSLPELLGGSRNWDYRYAWPRDASIGIAAFLAVGKPSEARAFLAWLLHASRLARPHLPVLFTIDGRPGPPEAQLGDWPGCGGSQPVRTGNGAVDQHQLDGYGWVVDAAWLLTDAGHHLYGETWRTVAGFADRVAATWADPDGGIWRSAASRLITSTPSSWRGWRSTVPSASPRARGPLLYRYPPGTDGLSGGEGAFLPCSFWLVHALVLTRRADEAASPASFPSVDLLASSAKRWTPPPGRTWATTRRPSPTPASSKQRLHSTKPWPAATRQRRQPLRSR